jgi:type II secretory pathway component PulC
MTLDRWFEKYFVWLALPFVAASGYFLADGAVRLRKTAAIEWTPPPVLLREAEAAGARTQPNANTVLVSNVATGEPQSATEFDIDRSVLDNALETQLRSVRVVPETKDGQVLGLRLFGIRPGSALAQIGLQNSDRVDSVNGFPIGTPEQALEAYGHLRTATTFIIALERRGSPVSLTIHIR